MLFVGAAALSMACGAPNDSPVAAHTTQRDSAGVTIVENSAPNPNARLPWTVDDSPRLDIGSLDGEEAYQLFRADHALQLDDGRLAVANDGSAEVRIFDSNGVHLATWGGQGEGPGEFRSPSRLGQWPGDSLGVWDDRLRRLTIFTGTGEVGRTIDLGSGDRGGAPEWHGVLPGGELIVSHRELTGGELKTGILRTPVSAATTTGSGQLLESLGEQPGTEIYMRLGEGTIDVFRYPFARGFTVMRFGDEILFGPNDRFEVRFHGRAGGLRRIVRLAIPPRPVTEADVEKEVERRVAAAPEESRAGIRATYREMPVPETFSAFSESVTDPLENLWVRIYEPPAEVGPGVWAVFDRDGVFLGYAETPVGLSVFQIGTDFLLGRRTDDLGVEHIQIWGLDRGL